MYDNYREEALKGLRTPSSETVKVVAVSAGYTYSAAHTSINDIPTGNRVQISDALTNKTFTGGVFDADDVTLTAVAAGSAISAVIVYTAAGTSASSTLHVYLDTGTGLPVTPNGGNIVISWAAASPKIYKL